MAATWSIALKAMPTTELVTLRSMTAATLPESAASGRLGSTSPAGAGGHHGGMRVDSCLGVGRRRRASR